MMSKPDPRPGEAPYLETGPWLMDRGRMRSLGGPGPQEEGMEADTQGEGSGREAQDAGAPSEGPGRKELPQVSAGAALQALATGPWNCEHTSARCCKLPDGATCSLRGWTQHLPAAPAAPLPQGAGRGSLPGARARQLPGQVQLQDVVHLREEGQQQLRVGLLHRRLELLCQLQVV